MLRPSSRIIGAHGLTVIEYTGGGSFLTADGADNIVLAGITLDGGLLALDPSAATALVSLRSCKHFVLDSLTVRRSLIDGVGVTGCSGRISNCIISQRLADRPRERRRSGVSRSRTMPSPIAATTASASGARNPARTAPSSPPTASSASKPVPAAAARTATASTPFAPRACSSAETASPTAPIPPFAATRRSNIQMIGNSCARIGEVALYAEFGFQGALIANNLVDGAASGIAVTNFNEGGRLAAVQGNIIRNLKRREAEPVDKRGEGISVEADAVVSGNVIEGAPTAGIIGGWGEYQARY